MLKLPKKPGGYRGDVLGDIIDYLKMITPLRHPDHAFEFTPSGLIIKNAKNAADALEEFLYKRFRLDVSSSLKMTVRAGWYTLNGSTVYTKYDTDITGPGDDGGRVNDTDATAFAATFAASKTYSFYLGKHQNPDGYHDTMIAPDKLYLYCVEGTMPAEGVMRFQGWLLGSIQTDADANLDATTLTRNWIGDADELSTVPDGELNPDRQYHIQTMQWRKSSDEGGYNELEAWLAHSKTLAGGSNTWNPGRGFFSLEKNADNKGSAQWIGTDTGISGVGSGQNSIKCNTSAVGKYWLEICNMDEAAVTSTGTKQLCYRTAADGIIHFVDSAYLSVAYADTAGTVTSGGLKHTDLDSSGSDGDFVDDGGDSNADHDRRYWKNYAAGVDSKNFRTTGAVWASSIHISANGSTDSQYWNATDLIATLSGSAEITAVSNINLVSESIQLNCSSGSIYYGGTAGNGTAGISGTLTLDDGANWRITLTFTEGGLTGQTIAASSAAAATWA